MLLIRGGDGGDGSGRLGKSYSHSWMTWTLVSRKQRCGRLWRFARLCRISGRATRGGEERESLVLAGEAVGGVDLVVTAREQGGLIGAAEDCRLSASLRPKQPLRCLYSHRQLLLPLLRLATAAADFSPCCRYCRG